MRTRNAIWAEVILSVLKATLWIALRLVPLGAERRRLVYTTINEMLAAIICTEGLGPLCAIWGGRDVNATQTLRDDIVYIVSKLAEHDIGTETGGSYEGVMHFGLAGGNGHVDLSKRPWHIRQLIRLLRLLVGQRPLGVAKVGQNLSQEMITPSPFQNVRIFHSQLWSRLFGFFVDCTIGAIIFPGGIGTDDEESGKLTNLKLHVLPYSPTVFFGTAYWGPKLAAREKAFADRKAPNYLAGLYTLTDDRDEAVRIIVAHNEKLRAEGKLPVRHYSVLERWLHRLEYGRNH
jgi:Possible lysine decarboxylase